MQTASRIRCQSYAPLSRCRIGPLSSFVLSVGDALKRPLSPSRSAPTPSSVLSNGQAHLSAPAKSALINVGFDRAHLVPFEQTSSIHTRSPAYVSAKLPSLLVVVCVSVCGCWCTKGALPTTPYVPMLFLFILIWHLARSPDPSKVLPPYSLILLRKTLRTLLQAWVK